MVAGYMSLVLLGLLYLAVGTLASALTANQTLAFLGTFLFLLLYTLVTSDLVGLPRGVARIAAQLSMGPKLLDFAKGVIDTAHVVFFLSGVGLFLMLAYVAVQVRRWR